MSKRFLHPISPRAVPRSIYFSTEYCTRALHEDRPILERIVAAYQCARSKAFDVDSAYAFGATWGQNGFAGKQAELIAALDTGSVERLHGILRQLFLTDATHALGMGREEAALLLSSSSHLHDYGLQWLDLLLGVAFAVGALSVPNPHDGSERWEKCLEADADLVIACVEQRTGFKLGFPDVGGVFGGMVKGRAFPLITFMHFLVAVTIRTLLPDRPSVVELGGGFGGLAHLVTQALPIRYTIYDLSFINALQAYFLHRAMPERPLVLYGEDPAVPDTVITILPAWQLLRPEYAETIDLVVSQDNLVEIPRATAIAYLRALQECLRGPLLSVNPEYPGQPPPKWDGTRVLDLVDEIGGWRCLSRSPFPLRPGHIQEIFLPKRLDGSISMY